MKLHADHRTVFEIEHGVLARKVAEFERAEDAQEYVSLHGAITDTDPSVAEAEAQILRARIRDLVP